MVPDFSVTTQFPITSTSMPVFMNVSYASCGVQTIGSPRTLNDVLITIGTPDGSASRPVRIATRGQCHVALLRHDGDAGARDGSPVVTIEDHSLAGGFGSAVLETSQELGLAVSRMARLGLPADRLIAHGPRAAQLAECGLDTTGIAAKVLAMVNEKSETVERHTTRSPASLLPRY